MFRVVSFILVLKKKKHQNQIKTTKFVKSSISVNLGAMSAGILIPGRSNQAEQA